MLRYNAHVALWGSPKSGIHKAVASRFVSLLDLDLTAHDIQTLNDADALVAFFSRLGYHTNARIIQTAANLGMVAEVVAKPIRRIERIANHEDALQVYLFEVASVTATQRSTPASRILETFTIS